MMRHLTHPLLLCIAAAAALYMVFGFVVQPPLPKSLLIQYMVISVIGIFLVASFNDATWRRTTAPILDLLGNPDLSRMRAVVFAIIAGGAGWFSYDWVKPDLDAPIELRTVHPAPPSTIKVYGKTYDLLTLENPLRAEAEKGSEEFAEMVAEGGELYYKNCMFCHGDLLDGAGHFAEALNPRPANFQDVGTIAQLQESYLFWRITTGGPGLPREGAPWASAMPVWHEMLEEEEVWKIILFLYDYTGHEPRSWDLESGATATAEDTASETSGELDEEQIETLYLRRCAHCHGEDGDGMGPAAEYMYPLPRDFTLAVFKYKTTHADDEFPTDDDLRRTINEGLIGTAMPGWESILKPNEVDALIGYIKEFGGWEEEEIEHAPIDMGEKVPSSVESIARGEKLFVKACVQCHGAAGRGNITSGKKLKDDWQYRIWPRNLTRPETWRASETAEHVFHRISGGIRGTPMPEHTTTMPIEHRWDVANYVMSLRDNAVPLSRGDTVVRATRVDGKLPQGPDDPVWDGTPAITLPMMPNIIREPRLFHSLNPMVTVRALFNDRRMAIRLDVDDRTRSVPGATDEIAYRQEEIEPTSDAVAVQLPASMPVTNEKPWFRHGNRKLPVNLWYWNAGAEDPERPATVAMLDAHGPDSRPLRRETSALSGTGDWRDGQWRIVLARDLETEDPADLPIEIGRYIPVAFANWDGVNGERGARHSFTSWYWLLLEPDVSTVKLYASAGGGALIMWALLWWAARQARGRRA